MCGRAMYCVLGWCTVWSGGALCVSALYCVVMCTVLCCNVR